jgi:hypothetical protein
MFYSVDAYSGIVRFKIPATSFCQVTSGSLAGNLVLLTRVPTVQGVEYVYFLFTQEGNRLRMLGSTEEQVNSQVGMNCRFCPPTGCEDLSR